MRLDREESAGLSASKTKDKLEELRQRRLSSSNDPSTPTSRRQSTTSSPSTRSGRASPTSELDSAQVYAGAAEDLEKNLRTMGIIRHLREDLVNAQTALAEERRRFTEELDQERRRNKGGGGDDDRRFPGNLSVKEANEALIASLGKEVEELRNFKARAVQQVSSLKQSQDDDGGSRKMVETLTATNIDLKKRIRKYEAEAEEMSGGRDVLMALDDSQKAEITALRRSLDALEQRVLSSQEENARLDRSLQIERASNERHKAMVETLRDREEEQPSGLSAADRQGLSSLEVARMRRAQESSALHSRSLALQGELRRLAALEGAARLERLEAMLGPSLDRVFSEELRWLRNDADVCEGIAKAAVACGQLLLALPLVEGATDEHKTYAAVLRVAVHVDVCVDLLKGACLALAAAGAMLCAPPVESSDFVPVVSALREAASLVCAKLEADGDLSSTELVTKLSAVVSSPKHQHLDQPASKGVEADPALVWEQLVHVAFYVASIEAMAVGGRHYYRLADAQGSSGEARQLLTAGCALADAIVAASCVLSESSKGAASTKGTTGDAAWRANGLNAGNVAQLRNDALLAMQRFSAEYSLVGAEADRHSRPAAKAAPALLERATLARYNKSLEALHAEVSKIVAFARKMGIRLPRITDAGLAWGLLSRGLSLEVGDAKSVRSFDAGPCDWRARAERVAQRVEAVMSREGAIGAMQAAASSQSSAVGRKEEELAAAMNRAAELDHLLAVYVGKNAALEEGAKAAAAASSRVAGLEGEIKVRTAALCVCPDVCARRCEASWTWRAPRSRRSGARRQQ